MEKEYKSPHCAYQNVISFTCSDSAIEPLVELFKMLNTFGEIGCSRELTVSWDGDGPDRLDNITVNGLTLQEWNKEWDRLDSIRKMNPSNNKSSNESEGNGK